MMNNIIYNALIPLNNKRVGVFLNDEFLGKLYLYLDNNKVVEVFEDYNTYSKKDSDLKFRFKLKDIKEFKLKDNGLLISKDNFKIKILWNINNK